MEGEDYLLLDLTSPEVAIDVPSNGVLSALLLFRLPVRDPKPDCPAGTFKHFNYEKIVVEAERLLFKVTDLTFDCMPPFSRTFFASAAEGLLSSYRAGVCLNCISFMKEIDREGDSMVLRRILREFLVQCDLAGEPIPAALIKWSAESRFEQPPTGPKGRPIINWYRDGMIVLIVATLAYKTGRKATRNDATEPHHSVCDAVAFIFKKNGSIRKS